MTQLNNSKGHGSSHKFSFGMFLVTIGIVYGDIGTSPLYVIKSIMEGNGGLDQIDPDFIIGSLSLIIWTVTLLTTIKYVIIAMKADNNGEGGIFSLYSKVRQSSWYGLDSFPQIMETVPMFLTPKKQADILTRV